MGKVKNIAANINAAFIEIADGQLCYYALNDNETPIFTVPKKKKALVAGDELLVQVSREAVKTKAPTVSGNLNFAGKYLVLTSGKRHLGLSSKLAPAEKERLRAIAEPFLGEDFGIIVRTNAAGISEEELTAGAERADRNLPPHRGNRSEPDLFFPCIQRTLRLYYQTAGTARPTAFEKILTDCAGDTRGADRLPDRPSAGRLAKAFSFMKKLLPPWTASMGCPKPLMRP